MLLKLLSNKVLQRAPKLLTSVKFVNFVSTTADVSSKILNVVPEHVELRRRKFIKKFSLPKCGVALLSDKPKIDVPILWVLGGPGAGKGTQCDKIVAKYGFTHLSTGDLLRDEVKSGSPRGKELLSIMERGALVPMDVVLELLKEAMYNSLPNSTGFLIDGYPREYQQGVLFEEKIAPVDIILFFDADEDVLVQRLLGRGQTSGRADDNPETIKKRLQTFNKHNNEIVTNYSAKLKRIDASGDAESVFQVDAGRNTEVIFAEVESLLEPYAAKAK